MGPALMTTINHTLGEMVTGFGQESPGGGVPIPMVAPKGSVGQFDAAMARATGTVQTAQLDPAVRTVGQTPAATPAGTAPPTDGTVGNPGTEARERARRALGLDAPAAAAPPAGDAIIEGMQKLRGVFDGQVGRINSISGSKNLDIGSLMSMQMELVRFSLLVEVTSKLTGKSTQAFDTLMKG